MNKLSKKGLIKLIIFLMVVSTPVYAFSNYDDGLEGDTIIKPSFTNISIFVNTFEISAYGKTSVTSYLTARNINRVRIQTNLQQFKNGKWVSIKRWIESSNSTNCMLNGSYYVPKGYFYRTVSKGMVYKNGLLIESTNFTSKIKSY